MEIEQQWMLTNTLTTNARKTKATVISTKKKLMFDYSIKYEESLIRAQWNVKYLDLNIDDKLNFKKHIKIFEGRI